MAAASSVDYDKGTASPVVDERDSVHALFDGTAQLTVDGVVVLIPTPSLDPRGWPPLKVQQDVQS